jgi:hypothetical protein
MQRTHQYNKPKILYTGENHRPDKMGVDYSMSFDRHSPTNYHLPLWQVECMQHPEFFQMLFNRPQHEFTYTSLFCSYTVSNPSVKERNDVFIELSKYRRVCAYGKNFNNEESMPPTGHPNKIKFLLSRPHKFAVAYESGVYEGYCTEKILHAFLVGSIPIYKGDPSIEQQFNPMAFINANDMSEKDVADYVRYLDRNPDKFKEIYSQPVFTEQQRQDMLNNISGLEPWLLNVVYRILNNL